jgi:hypothetical protein
LHELVPKKDGSARISPLWILEWDATMDGRPPVLHEPALEKDGGARTSPLRFSPLWILEWGATVNGGAARDGARRSRGATREGRGLGGRGARGSSRGVVCAPGDFLNIFLTLFNQYFNNNRA